MIYNKLLVLDTNLNKISLAEFVYLNYLSEYGGMKVADRKFYQLL